jgi:hypothetical protein
MRVRLVASFQMDYPGVGEESRLEADEAEVVVNMTGGSGVSPLLALCASALNLNKAVGITRRVRVGQFQLPYVLPAA